MNSARTAAWIGFGLMLLCLPGCQRYPYRRGEGQLEPIFEADPSRKVEWIAASGSETGSTKDPYPYLEHYIEGGTIKFVGGPEVHFRKIVIFTETPTKFWIITKFPSRILAKYHMEIE